MHITFKRLLFLFLLPQISWAQNPDQIDFKSKFDQAVADYQKFESDHGHYIQTPNVNMHYSTWGNPQDTPLVWVHGSYQNSTEILEIVDRLVAAHIYVIAIDYYGHGLTDIPDKDVSIYHVADDIDYLLDHLHIDQTIIGGWSRGGTIVSAFYDSYPEKVKGIILEDGGSANWLLPRQMLSQEEVKNWYTKMSQYMNHTTFETQFDAFKHYYKEQDSDSQFWRLAYIKSNENDFWAWNLGLSEWLEESTIEDGVNGVFRTSTCSQFKSSTLFLQPLIVYRNLDVPMLIFDPTKDDANGFMNLTKQNQQLKSAHPELITYLVYVDASHSVHYQQPDKFTTDVLAFINSLK
ncbi:alpha/beta hydrolase [bacterium SCSIO 12643]|nr:alpha/beta hydrolase [bacterium SCSIO 12643]